MSKRKFGATSDVFEAIDFIKFVTGSALVPSYRSGSADRRAARRLAGKHPDKYTAWKAKERMK